MNTIRKREERLKSIGPESLKLIEDKRRLQQDLSNIIQELKVCVREMGFLKAKTESILSRLAVHEKEVLDSVSSIILARQEARPAGNRAKPPAPAPDMELETPPSRTEIPQEKGADTAPAKPPRKSDAILDSIYKIYKSAEKSRFPKSIIKTDRGRILGEYYYDQKVYKNARSYIFNGRYFADQVRKGLDFYEADPVNEAILNDLLLMAADIQNRLKTRDNIHLENSTNEILNAGSLDELIDNIKARRLEAVDGFCRRLAEKIEVLGQGYELMLAEQLNSLATKNPNAS